MVAHFELGGILFHAVLLSIAADAGAGAAADLGHAVFDDHFAGALRFARGDDQARIGDGDTQDGHDLLEELVGDGIAEVVHVDVIRIAQAGDADRVRPDAVNRFEVFGVHQKADKIIAVQVQAKQDATSYVVDAALHGAVHRFGVVGVVALRPCGM